MVTGVDLPSILTSRITSRSAPHPERRDDLLPGKCLARYHQPSLSWLRSGASLSVSVVGPNRCMLALGADTCVASNARLLPHLAAARFRQKEIFQDEFPVAGGK